MRPYTFQGRSYVSEDEREKFKNMKSVDEASFSTD